ncbi:phosphoribosylglycinamide formyltransferase-1 [Oikeobacillus pervagus]|uniref:Phosphoribosylglycinamide formyltransferase n=1 Tax=Oikeobacillus pervagus TaxID=1325931 RepID=A0AAJ1T1Q4_9BACI|nr:phosphoribosylglycinamide formyltransferase [Oikeobacillus pervagus]MDQ0215577.1 phosphoribosylglycinamide formyltransferase-1 [Oikeobacillus pervagus]
MKKFAVFASGNGSNFQVLAEAVNNGLIEGTIELVVCDQPNAFVVQRANELHIPVFTFQAKNYPSKADFEKEIINELQQRDVDFIVLAGYMRLVGPTLLEAYSHRIVNIHPSLLPSFPGKDAVGQALKAGVKITGVTIHFVDEGMDTGPIIAQKAVEITPDDTHETLQGKIQQVEHSLYPQVVNQMIQQLDRSKKEEEQNK